MTGPRSVAGRARAERLACWAECATTVIAFGVAKTVVAVLPQLGA
ncbi:hypothetical protein [Microbispora bryophytorum]|nr:hypothetical protein [Microbispora camponoti]